MKELVSHFERLTAIITNPCNCLHHIPALRQLIYNFHHYYTSNDLIDVEREVDVLTYVLHLKLDEIEESKFTAI